MKYYTTVHLLWKKRNNKGKLYWRKGGRELVSFDKDRKVRIYQ